MENLQVAEYDLPRARILQKGGACLSDAELLGVLFGTGIKGKTAAELGRSLLCEFGGLRELLLADENALKRVAGVGAARVAQLRAVIELNRRYLDERLRRQGPLSSPAQASDFLMHNLRDLKREVFAVLYLDTRHQVIDYEELFYGTLNGATVHPREVVRSVLEKNASAVILAHNHPSGIAEPSQSDSTLTKRLREALELIDVRLLDHLVIGDGEFVSMSDRGLF